MLEIDFNNLSLKNIGTWPKGLLAIMLLAIVGGTLGLAYTMWLREQQNFLQQQLEIEQEQRVEFSTQFNLIANQQNYAQQLTSKQQQYDELLKLISFTEMIPLSLQRILGTADKYGLRVEALNMNEPSNADFFNATDIDLTLLGTYHGIGRFVSELVDMEQLITLHNFRIKAAIDDDADQDLRLTVAIRIYTHIGSGIHA